MVHGCSHHNLPPAIETREQFAKPRPRNWPPFRPLFHHDLEGDIKDEAQRAEVKKAYIAFFGTLLLGRWGPLSPAA